MEIRNTLCHGLKRVVKVEFDESGNPKEINPTEGMLG